LTVSYTDSNGPQSFPISNGGNLDIPGDATGMTVTVGTYNDEIFEGVESFELDVTVTGSIGDNNEALNLSDSGGATIIDDGGEVNNDTPVLTVSDAGQIVEGNPAQFDVSLDKEVDGTLNYVFTLDVDEPLTAEVADFLANGNLTVSYT
ncbi:hypothetical protein, partial [Vibrio ouci]|uniref:hypothetical protein n=1 Tax=Vibrio ouci TaxID=2499078 RepID=UPI00142D3418